MADKRITDVDIIDSLNSDESFFVNQNSTIKQVNKSNIIWSVNNGGTGATTAKDARVNLGAVTMTNTTIELTSDNWVDNQQTVSMNDVTTDNTVIVSADFSTDNYKYYSRYGIRCIEQTDGKLIFACDKTPSIMIVVNVVIFS